MSQIPGNRITCECGAYLFVIRITLKLECTNCYRIIGEVKLTE